MKRETLTHPKTLDLASRLGCSRPEALGYLTLLWDWTADYAIQGDIGKWPNGSIARACDWTGDADEFVGALVDSRWIDKSDSHRLVIHDWPDHCERWVRAKMQKMKVDFLSVYSTEPTVERTVEATAEPSPPRDPTEPNRTKPNQTKPNGRFCKPSVDEVRAYCTERGNSVDAQAFWDFYESKGWRVGNAPMKDWQACVRTWESRAGPQAVASGRQGKNYSLDFLK